MSSERREDSSIFSEALRCMLRLSGVRGTSWSSKFLLLWTPLAEGVGGTGDDCSSGGGGMTEEELRLRPWRDNAIDVLITALLAEAQASAIMTISFSASSSTLGLLLGLKEIADEAAARGVLLRPQPNVLERARPDPVSPGDGVDEVAAATVI